MPVRWESVRTIAAPRERVFRAVADPEEFQKAIPGGSTVEYLTAGHQGVGTKFRATRLVKGKPNTFDQEVTEFVPDERVRLVNVTHGTVWDSTAGVSRVSRRNVTAAGWMSQAVTRACGRAPARWRVTHP